MSRKSIWGIEKDYYNRRPTVKVLHGRFFYNVKVVGACIVQQHRLAVNRITENVQTYRRDGF